MKRKILITRIFSQRTHETQIIMHGPLFNEQILISKKNSFIL